MEREPSDGMKCNKTDLYPCIFQIIRLKHTYAEEIKRVDSDKTVLD